MLKKILSNNTKEIVPYFDFLADSPRHMGIETLRMFQVADYATPLMLLLDAMKTNPFAINRLIREGLSTISSIDDSSGQLTHRTDVSSTQLTIEDFQRMLISLSTPEKLLDFRNVGDIHYQFGLHVSQIDSQVTMRVEQHTQAVTADSKNDYRDLLAKFQALQQETLMLTAQNKDIREFNETYTKALSETISDYSRHIKDLRRSLIRSWATFLVPIIKKDHLIMRACTCTLPDGTILDLKNYDPETNPIEVSLNDYSLNKQKYQSGKYILSFQLKHDEKATTFTVDISDTDFHEILDTCYFPFNAPHTLTEFYSGISSEMRAYDETVKITNEETLFLYVTKILSKLKSELDRETTELTTKQEKLCIQASKLFGAWLSEAASPNTRCRVYSETHIGTIRNILEMIDNFISKQATVDDLLSIIESHAAELEFESGAPAAIIALQDLSTWGYEQKTTFEKAINRIISQITAAFDVQKQTCRQTALSIIETGQYIRDLFTSSIYPVIHKQPELFDDCKITVRNKAGVQSHDLKALVKEDALSEIISGAISIEIEYQLADGEKRVLTLSLNMDVISEETITKFILPDASSPETPSEEYYYRILEESLDTFFWDQTHGYYTGEKLTEQQQVNAQAVIDNIDALIKRIPTLKALRFAYPSSYIERLSEIKGALDAIKLKDYLVSPENAGVLIASQSVDYDPVPRFITGPLAVVEAICLKLDAAIAQQQVLFADIQALNMRKESIVDETPLALSRHLSDCAPISPYLPSLRRFSLDSVTSHDEQIGRHDLEEKRQDPEITRRELIESQTQRKEEIGTVSETLKERLLKKLAERE
jgi:hypothetical protein